MHYLFLRPHFITNNKAHDISILVRDHHCWQHIWIKIPEVCAHQKIMMHFYTIYKSSTAIQVLSYFTSVVTLSDPARSSAHSPTFPSLHLRHNSFSNPSVAFPTSQLILKPLSCSTYASTAVGEAAACAPVTQRDRVRSPVGTSFLGEGFSGFFLACQTNVRKL